MNTLEGKYSQKVDKLAHQLLSQNKNYFNSHQNKLDCLIEASVEKSKSLNSLVQQSENCLKEIEIINKNLSDLK